MLPRSLNAFREIVASARDYGDRAGILGSIQAAHRSVVWSRSLTKEDKALATRLYEERLLEFIRSPLIPRHAKIADPLDRLYDEACSSLVRIRSERLPEVLLSWCDGNAGPARISGAYFLGYLALDPHLEAVERIVANDDWHIGAAALTGAGLAAHHRHASGRYRDRIFDAGISIVCGKRPLQNFPLPMSGHLDFVKGMIRLRRRRAVALFRSAACLRVENPLLREIVWNLQPDSIAMEGYPPVMVKPSVLWPVYDALRSEHSAGVPDDNRDFAMGGLLVLAATSDPEAARSEARALKKELKGSWCSLLGFAEEAYRRAKRVPEPDAALRWMEQNPGELPEPHESVLLAYELLDHVNNDGLLLYILNRYESVEHALQGLAILKQKKAAAIVEAAFRTLGPVSPSSSAPGGEESDHDLSPDQELAIDALDTRLERHHDKILRSIETYLAKHATDFSRLFRVNSK